MLEGGAPELGGDWEVGIHGIFSHGLSIGGWCSSIVPKASDLISPYIFSDSPQYLH
jgi:hypothetical protein